MTIVEYILDPQDQPRSYFPKTKPSYITDGGYWTSKDGKEKMIGVGLEGSIPDSATTLTLEELQARQRAIHAEHPMKNDKDPVLVGGIVEPLLRENLTDEEVNTVIKEWVDART